MEHGIQAQAKNHFLSSVPLRILTKPMFMTKPKARKGTLQLIILTKVKRRNRFMLPHMI